MDNYQNNESKIDYGVTTGSLATATSLAALEKIVHSNQNISIVKITTPFDEFNVDIKRSNLISENKAEFSAIKYPYNDHYVTINVEIVYTIELLNKTEFNDLNYKIKGNGEEIIIEGGVGVGTITKPGLQIPPNHPAINPVPLQMIKENLKSLITHDKIAKVTISISDGEKLVKKTMNLKLGIVGGISILGTTGIARTMSIKAYKDFLLCQFDVTLAMVSKGLFNKEDIVFVPGNIGEKLALKNLKNKDNSSLDKDQLFKWEILLVLCLKKLKKEELINSFYMVILEKLLN